MKLEQISQRITSIQEEMSKDQASALDKWDELFTDLLRRDEFYILNDPAVATVENNGERYFQVFTHSSLADPQGEYSQTDSLSLVIRARELFFDGVSGILLNNGDVWGIMSLPEFIDLFLKLVGILESDPRFIDVIHDYHAGNLFYRRDEEKIVLNTAQGEGYEPFVKDVFETADLPATLSNGQEVSAEFIHQVLATPHRAAAPEELRLAVCEPQEPAKTKKRRQKKEGERSFHLPEFHWDKWKERLAAITVKQWAVLGGIFAGIILLIVLICILCNSGISKFKKAIDRGDYTTAQSVYYSYSGSRREEASEYLADKPQELVTEYAVGDISGAEFETAISALSVYPSIQDEVKTAATAGAALKQSKADYQTGADSSDVPTKLSYWEKVIAADIESQEKIQKDLDENSKRYKAAMLQAIDERRSSGLYGSAYSLAALMNRWYPDDEDASAAVEELKEYQDQADPTLTAIPVKIISVSTSIPDINNKVNLFIKWKNASGKTIKKVTFSVLPISNLGRDVSDELFLAVDAETYDPGEGPSLDSWGWRACWKGADIEGAKVISVEVLFDDGVTKTFDLGE